MKKLNLYITKQIIIGFLLVAFSLMSLLWLTQSLRFVELVTNKGLPVSIFVEMTSLLMPRLFTLLSPISLFIACLFTFNRMLTDRELVVIKAAGISPLQSIKPVVFIGIFLALLSFYINNVSIPKAEKAFNELEWKIKNDLSHLFFKEGEFTLLQPGLTIFITSQEKDGSISGIIVNDERNPKTKTTITAEKGRIVNTDTNPRIIMVKGSRQEITLADSRFSSLSFDRYSIDVGTAKSDRKKEAEVREHSLLTLLSARNNPNLSERQANRYVVEGHKRILNPLYNILFAILGCTGLLIGSFNRRGQVRIISVSIFLLIVIQAAELSFSSLTVKNFYLLPLLYLNFLLPLAACFYFILFYNPAMLSKKKKLEKAAI